MTTDYTHPEYDAFLPKWTKVRDACAGEEAIKAKGVTYLPDPGEADTDQALRTRRYAAYSRRACYYNATGRTLSGLVGVAFANWPQIDVGSAKVLLSDASGSGVGLINQSQGVLANVLQTGRAGLLSDFTRTEEADRIRPRTVAQVEAAGGRPFISPYEAEQILTWETNDRGALSRVVLRESHTQYVGGQVQYLPQLRELILIDGKYCIVIWRRLTEKGAFIEVDRIPTSRDFIPFAFIGATNNDVTPDKPPLLDLADLNLHHYCNSADYEESVFLMGQPQLVVTGVDQEWKEKAGTIALGARAGLVLPVNGDAKILQVSPNTLAKEAMDAKQEQMQQLGAKLLATGGAAITATQSASETKATYSILSLACDNVSDAYTKALQWASAYVGGSQKGVFAIDTRFNDLTLDANAIRETVAAWQAGIVPQSDAWAVLRKLNVIDQGKTDAKIASEIEGQGPQLNLDEAA